VARFRSWPLAKPLGSIPITHLPAEAASHINVEAGFGEWLLGLALLQSL
jgi:predicted alpha/beta hydrolase family esterase